MAQQSLLTIKWKNTTAEEVRNLLANGAKANAYNEDGWTPLMMACNEGASLGVIKALVLDGKACVNAANPNNGITALMISCRSRSSSVVRFLLNQNADDTAVDRWCWTPMMYARHQNNKHNIQCLRKYAHEHQRG